MSPHSPRRIVLRDDSLVGKHTYLLLEFLECGVMINYAIYMRVGLLIFVVTTDRDPCRLLGSTCPNEDRDVVITTRRVRIIVRV